jgi:hypothetical protein
MFTGKTKTHLCLAHLMFMTQTCEHMHLVLTGDHDFFKLFDFLIIVSSITLCTLIFCMLYVCFYLNSIYP